MTHESIQVAAVFVTAICSAILAVAAVAGGFWRWRGKHIKNWFERLDTTMDLVSRHLVPNGSEKYLPVDQRDLPMRTLLIQHLLLTGPIVDVFLKEHPGLAEEIEHVRRNINRR